MSETLVIESHEGPYTVHFDEDALGRLDAEVPENAHFIVDERVAGLYASAMPNILAAPSVLTLEATEANKSLERFPAYIEHLVAQKIRRDHTLIAIGGGVIQDITCFLAATLLRGVAWKHYPTTLLAQADSCIGSKSSINVGGAKNILGTFTPANEVFISARFLETLDEEDVRSGVGEILKVHAIGGPEKFAALAADYPRLFSEPRVMISYVRAALAIKKPYIEIDEFDRKERNIFNYGHSFGHAIEAATDFGVPHGIAVTMGMDMANCVAESLGVCGPETFARMHPTLKANFRGYEDHPVATGPLLAALAKDKKNTGRGTATLILPDKSARLIKSTHKIDDKFGQICAAYLGARRNS